ncbi:MAG: Gfo/Idh/MocA family oxidoreductase [Chloroflexi bacterium]|nr:Gfo/Idh/MocA family oxidoreductase [Chloroflexota bacterium]
MNTPSTSPDTFGLLLISCVRHQRAYAPQFAGRPDVRIVAVADEAGIPDWMHQVNQEFADSYQVPYIKDVAAALSRPDVDLVSICSEPTRHARLAIQAAQAGKHIFVDKPMATTVADADQVVAAVDAAGVKLTYVHRLFSPTFQKARASINSGDVGLPYALHLSFISAGGLTSGAVEDFQMVVDRRLSGGGEMMNFMVYPVGAAQYLAGLKVTQVYATAGNYFFAPHKEHGVEDFGVACLTMERNVTATIVVGRSPTPNFPVVGDIYLRIHGTAGTLILDEHRPRLSIYAEAPAPRSRYMNSDLKTSVGLLIDDLIASIRHNRSPLRTARDGQAITAVIEAAYRSVSSGQVENVP